MKHSITIGKNGKAVKDKLELEVVADNIRETIIKNRLCFGYHLDSSLDVKVKLRDPENRFDRIFIEGFSYNPRVVYSVITSLGYSILNSSICSDASVKSEDSNYTIKSSPTEELK